VKIQGAHFAWAALVVAGLVTLQELTWLGGSSLARVIAALGLSVVLLAVSVLTGKQAK
jgi:hypothetical protein